MRAAKFNVHSARSIASSGIRTRRGPPLPNVKDDYLSAWKTARIGGAQTPEDVSQSPGCNFSGVEEAQMSHPRRILASALVKVS